MISIALHRARLWSPTPQHAEFLQAIEATSRFLHDLPAAARQNTPANGLRPGDRKSSPLRQPVRNFMKRSAIWMILPS